MKLASKEKIFKMDNVFVVADHKTNSSNVSPMDFNNPQSTKNNIEINLNKNSSDESLNQNKNKPNIISQQYSITDVINNLDNSVSKSKLSQNPMENTISNILIPTAKKDSTLSPAMSRRGRASKMSLLSADDKKNSKLESYKNFKGMEAEIVWGADKND